MARATKTASEVLRRATPGRVQVQISYYDKAKRVFRPVPGMAIYVEASSGAVVRRMREAIKAAVEEATDDDPVAPAADLPARAVAGA